MYHILICDDEQDIVNALKIYLMNPDFKLFEANTGVQALEVMEREDIHLILLDIMIPEMDGISAMVKIREKSNVPIILLTAKSEDTDKILGLNTGADDYITKPFGSSELLARIRTSLRHAAIAASPSTMQYRAGDLTVDYEKHVVTLKGEAVHLTQIEFKLLSLLSKNAGKVLTYSYIMEQIWGPYVDSNNQILRVNMANIRRKIEKNPAQPEFIFTEIGVGYRMVEANA